MYYMTIIHTDNKGVFLTNQHEFTDKAEFDKHLKLYRDMYSNDKSCYYAVVEVNEFVTVISMTHV